MDLKLSCPDNKAFCLGEQENYDMTSWSREELVDSLSESLRRIEEHERKLAQEKEYQERLYEILGKVLAKSELPRAFDQS